jgi:hypothetical protein
VIDVQRRIGSAARGHEVDELLERALLLDRVVPPPCAVLPRAGLVGKLRAEQVLEPAGRVGVTSMSKNTSPGDGRAAAQPASAGGSSSNRASPSVRCSPQARLLPESGERPGNGHAPPAGSAPSAAIAHAAASGAICLRLMFATPEVAGLPARLARG